MASVATIKKNSGILRYSFAGETAVLFGTPAVKICLGVPADMPTPDRDGQLFGESCGHPDVPAIPGTAFTGALAAQIGVKLGKTDTDPGNAGAYIPHGTKCYAWFTPSSAASSKAWHVQTQIVQNVPYVTDPVTGLPVPGQPEDVILDSTGRQQLRNVYLSAILVGLVNDTDRVPLEGELIVRLEHSFEDVPGLYPQNVIVVEQPPPGP